MPEAFETALAELAAQLSLPPFKAADGRVEIRIDALAVEIRESRDGRGIVVRASPGRLSDDPGLRGEQTRRLLKEGLGLIASSSAGIVVEGDADGGRLVVALAVYPYRARRVKRLVEAIEDVVAAAERFAPLLANRRAAAADRPRTGPDLPEALIFRP